MIRRNINRIINKISKHLYRVWFGRRLKLDYNKNYNIAGNVRDLIIAFSVLFSEGANPEKEYNYEIPTALLFKYANLLGIQVNISRYVTTMMIRNCNNYDSIKLDILSKLINKLEEDRDIAAKKIVKLIPVNAVVSAEQHFLPLLYKKKKMKVFPDEDISVEYILIDRLNPNKTGNDDTYLSFRLDPEFYYQKYLKNDNWTIVAEDKGVTLLKKNDLLK